MGRGQVDRKLVNLDGRCRLQRDRGGEITELLRLIGNRKNLVLLSSLAASPDYPRRLAARHGLRETHVARRLQSLERAGVVHSAWTRERGRNVKLYRLKTRVFTIELNQQGYRFETPILAVDREPADLERPPPHRPVFGRERELERLSRPEVRFSMVIGLAGMGKTSLATELAHRHGADRVIWHTFTPFDSALRLLGLARRWLAFLDPPRREEYESGTWDIAELLDRVSEGLSTNRALIVLDDYQEVRDDGIHEIVRRWQRTLANAKVVVLSRDRPPFDLDATTQFIMLSGLDRAASIRLLRESGLTASPDELRRLDRAFGGHPLSLRLYAQQPGILPDHARSVIEDVGREAFHALDGNSQYVLLALAAVRRPLGLEDIRFLTGFKDPGVPLAVLERRAMIRSEGRVYRIHDVLRKSLSTAVAARPEIHRRATALFLPSEHGDDVVEALYHATKVGDWSVAGNLLEQELEGEREMPSSSVNATVFLEILDGIPADKLDARHRAMYHRSHALALLGIAKTAVVIRELDAARRIAEPTGEPRLLSHILSPLGYYLGNTGRMAAAERTLLRNLSLVKSDGTLLDQADALFMLALLYDRQGKHEQAKEYWRKAVKVARRIRNRRLIFEFSTWHVAFPSDWRRMLPSLRRWRANFRRWGMTRQVHDMDILSGEILCRANRYRKVHREPDLRNATKLFKRAIIGCDAIGNRYEALYARSWLSLALFLAKELEGAEAEAKATLEADRKIGPSHCSILCHQVLSRVSLSRGDVEAALKHSDIALRHASRQNCGCTGIASLERAVLEAASGSEIALRDLMGPAVAETISKGYPDEVRYARRLARQYRVGLPETRGLKAFLLPERTDPRSDG